MPDTADLSRVLALARKGRELTMTGHSARAAEKFRLAVEEAEKALPVPDCLILCALRYERADSLLRHATASATRPADADDALREACLRLLPSVMAVPERRKAAGTLLPGSCRPEELTYQLAAKRREMEADGFTQAAAAKNAAVLAPHAGVETYLLVATAVAFMLINLDTPNRAFVLSDEQKRAAYAFLASALDLMARPRGFTTWLTGEPELVRQLRELVPAVSGIDEPETKKLCAAWRRVLRSGVLRTRGVDGAIAEGNRQTARLSAAAADDLAAGRLFQCALAGCAARESHASQFKRCGACRTVCYCCREHQVEDWPSHKAACKAACKADPAGASSEA